MARFQRFSRFRVRLPLFALPVALACGFTAAASAQFGSEHVIGVGNASLKDVHAADLDGDGDLDVIACLAAGSPTLRWYRNLGGGVFGSALAFPFQPTSAERARTLDIDADGDLDVVAVVDYYTPELGTDIELVVYKNAGGATFGFPNEYQFGGFQTSLPGLSVGDLEGDGDADVFIGRWGEATVLALPTVGGGLGPAKLVSSQAYAPRELLPCDLDGDGDADVVVASWTSDEIFWFENQGAAFGPEQTIDGAATGASHLAAADLDGDGTLDLVSSGSESGVNYLRWYQHLGNGSFTPHPIAFGSTFPGVVQTADLDGDGDQDLLVSEFFGLSWYPNDGQGQLGPRQAISNAISIGVTVEAADLDGDAVPDALSGSNPDLDALIAWYPNLFTAPWTNLLSGLDGLFGVPSLVGTGTLELGSTGNLVLSAAAPSSSGMLFASLGSTPAPFKCGTLVPVPVLFGFPVLTNPAGSLKLTWHAWPAGLSGASLYLQYAIVDGAAPCGVSLSNALRADMP